MARQKRKVEPLPTIWEVNDELWNIITPILDELDPPAKTGRPRTDLRLALNGIIHQMRSGCQWNQLPEKFGDDAQTTLTLPRHDLAPELFPKDDKTAQPRNDGFRFADNS